MYEVILARPLDKRNFRKKILGLGFVVPTLEKERNVPRRAAQLFRFDQVLYRTLSERGFDLDLV
jgi:8-oxo-dGTP diphosphatase